MTQVFSETGELIPVTKIAAGPCQVTQVKTKTGEQKLALQIGFGEKKAFRLSRPQAGHLKGLEPVSFLRDVLVESIDGAERGDLVTVTNFVIGEKVDVIGESKGRGFAGVVKRHGFHGGPASHGHKDNLRAPGSIGAGGVQRVFKGMRMAGHMGSDRVTIKNLEVIAINPETNEIFVKGAIPGGRNSLVTIVGEGKMTVQKKNQTAPVSEVEVVETTPAEAVAAVN